MNLKKIKNRVMSLIRETSVAKRYYVKKTLDLVVDSVLIPAELVKAAENDPKEQSKLLHEQMKKCPDKAEKTESTIDRLLDMRNLTSDERAKLKQDMLYSFFAYGYVPNEYVCYEFENKSLEERRAFVSERESVRFGYRVNDRSAVFVFLDKMDTYNHYKNYYGRDAIVIQTQNDYDAFCRFVSKCAVFVKKIVNESCGRSVELIDSTGMDKKLLFDELISAGKTIIEEPIRQHAEMAKINASSVNTIRCLTMNTDQGIIVPWCFLKAGRAGSFVDNGGAGGILVGIDPKTGIMTTDGYDEANTHYEVHPDSGVRFKGFEIPDWASMISICKEMAAQMPKASWIGWDMAYSENGWVVVEGNSLSEVIGPQTTFKSGIRADLNRYKKHMKAYYPDADI